MSTRVFFNSGRNYDLARIKINLYWLLAKCFAADSYEWNSNWIEPMNPIDMNENHEKKLKRRVPAASYDIFMKIHEKKAETKGFNRFIRYFHEFSWKKGRNEGFGRFVRYFHEFSWKKGRNRSLRPFRTIFSRIFMKKSWNRWFQPSRTIQDKIISQQLKTYEPGPGRARVFIL